MQKLRISARGWAHWIPSRGDAPARRKRYGRISTAGIKARPCRETARVVALAVAPMFCSSMLLRTIHPVRGRVTSWARKANTAIREASGLVPATVSVTGPASRKPQTARPASTAVASFTQKRKAAFTRS